jgi:hypothetical protein
MLMERPLKTYHVYIKEDGVGAYVLLGEANNDSI